MYPLVIAAVVILDHLSKYAVSSSMDLNSTVTLIPGIFDLTYILNDGAAYGMLAGRQTLLLAVTAVIMASITVYVVYRRKNVFFWEKLALALIVGGGLGNFISRAFRGCVVDFLNIHIIPVFNVADIAVCCGCCLLILSVLVLEPSWQKKQGASRNQNEQ